MTSLRCGVKLGLMKKLSLYIFLVLMWCNVAFANKYVLTCTGDKKFLTVFSVNEIKKEIIHLSSKSLKNDQVWNDLNTKLNIIYWSNNIVHSFDITEQGNPGLISFDLKNYHYIDTGHYLTLPDWEFGYAYNQLFKCIKG